MKYIIIILFFLFSLNAIAQKQPYRKYGTQQVHQRLLKENPTLLNKSNKIEKQIANFKLTGEVKEVTIPIVFHVLYNSVTERVSEAQILSQLEALNQDYTANIIDNIDKHDADIAENFEKYLPKKIGIQFCLASLQLGINNISAINYIPTQVTEWGGDDAIKSRITGGTDIVEPSKYLNIWIGNLADSISGYAQFPGGPDKTDGIVIDYHFFGTLGTAQKPYNLGKTLTHLVGSYLGLHELWNEQIPCRDDYVNDTPIHNAPNFGENQQYKHVSLCFDGDVEMTMNYMDNSDDNSLYMFTRGQMLRMQATIGEGGARNQLLYSNSICFNVEDLIEAESKFPKLKIATNVLKSPKLSVFPNPVNDILQIEIPKIEKQFSLTIYDIIGKLMYSENSQQGIGAQVRSLDVKTWETGTYFIHAKLGQENQSYRFIVVK